MRKKRAKLLALAGAILFAAGSSSGCRESDSAGVLLMAGSTSMEELVNALAEKYMEMHPDMTVSVEFVGSGAGIRAALSGTADIGNASRFLNEDEREQGAVETVVAVDGIAVCVDPANSVRNLTKRQLIDIYTGAVTNWSRLGGGDVPIVVLGREAGCGTRDAFEEGLGIRDECVYANVLDSNGAVMARTASTPGAIGYLSLASADNTVTILELEGTAPTPENIREGRYMLSRPFTMVTRGEISRQNRQVRDWFDYVLGREGQSIVSQLGLAAVE